jgi:hypothetical protein
VIRGLLNRNGASKNSQTVLRLSNLETTLSFQLDMADTQVRSPEIYSEVRTLLLSSRPAEDESGQHRLLEIGGSISFGKKSLAAKRGDVNSQLLDPS